VLTIRPAGILDVFGHLVSLLGINRGQEKLISPYPTLNRSGMWGMGGRVDHNTDLQGILQPPNVNNSYSRPINEFCIPTTQAGSLHKDREQ